MCLKKKKKKGRTEFKKKKGSFIILILSQTTPVIIGAHIFCVQGSVVQHGDGRHCVFHRRQHHHKGQRDCRTDWVSAAFFYLIFFFFKEEI
jgi:hypothetical protein